MLRDPLRARALTALAAPLILALVVGGAAAQDGGWQATPDPFLTAETPAAPPAPTLTGTPTPDWRPRVTTIAADGLVLAGDFYLVDGGQLTVLLLHQLYTDRTSWDVLVGPLVAAGFNVLAVDLRGHGLTGGALNWEMAELDVQAWLDWLRGVMGVQGPIAIIGSSMGSSLALTGCAHDLACRTAIAISPGWRYHGIPVRDVFARQMVDRAVLLVYATGDYWPSLGVPRMVQAAVGEVVVQQYPGNAHGMELFATQGDTLIPLIVSWLVLHGGA